MQQKIRIAIAGAGNIAQNAHLPAFMKRDDVEVVAVCDVNLERARECAKKYGIAHAFASAAEMIGQVECDATSACGTGPQGGCRARRPGRAAHPLRKADGAEPFACRGMKEAVEKAGVTFMMAMPRRFFPDGSTFAA